MKRIRVLGSLNIDVVQQVPRMPGPGETLKGSDLQIFVGGKGANQACAAALLGGNVSMAGMVGSDVFAERLIRELHDAGVATQLVRKSAWASGSAIILVLPNGENSIAISPGANADISVDFALEAIEDLEPGDLLLCQLEIPLAAVLAALQAASKKNVITILDPAPACALPDDLLWSVSILTPNQTETAILLGTPEVPEQFSQAEAAARKLQARGAKTVIVKMGAQGCFIADEYMTVSKPGYRVHAMDTTAAGDTFNGALAAALASGASLAEAASSANAAAALSVTKPGAIASMPRLSELQQFLSGAAVAGQTYVRRPQFRHCHSVLCSYDDRLGFVGQYAEARW